MNLFSVILIGAAMLFGYLWYKSNKSLQLSYSLTPNNSLWSPNYPFSSLPSTLATDGGSNGVVNDPATNWQY